MVTKSLLFALMAFDHTATGLPTPAHVPHVRTLSPCELMREADSNPTLDCSAALAGPAYTTAFYDPAVNTVYLSREWDSRDPYHRSILAHELVHYMQDMNGAVFAGCMARFERPAYKAQMAYLTAYSAGPKAYGFNGAFFAVVYACAPEYTQ